MNDLICITVCYYDEPCSKFSIELVEIMKHVILFLLLLSLFIR